MRRLDRRSFLLQVVGTAMAGSLAAQPVTGRRMVVDSDESDPARPIASPPPPPSPPAGVPKPADAAHAGATGGAAPAATFIVVRVSGPSAASYPVGRSLPEDARIILRAGDSLVVLGARGTQSFYGPGTFSPGAAGTAVGSGAPRGRSARIGAVRSPTGRFVVCPGHPRCPR